jgi:tryptophan-rich sensory protein
MKINTKTIPLLVGSIAAPLFAGMIGSAFTVKNIPTWYEQLEKPFFNPPNWIFGPVWTILYLMMGVSLFLILLKQKDIFSVPVKIFLLHLCVNSFWSIAFFGMKNLGLAFVVIMVLGGLILYLINIFYRIDKRASYLLFPYLAWVSFASLLNLSVWYLNR